MNLKNVNLTRLFIWPLLIAYSVLFLLAALSIVPLAWPGIPLGIFALCLISAALGFDLIDRLEKWINN